jgi:hypothetical protein
MSVLERLLNEDFQNWDKLMLYYEDKNKKLRVPSENTSETLHTFNINLNELFTEASYDFARARRNKEAIERLLESTLKDYYKGSNELARKAGGIQYARVYPAPDFWPQETINLFDLEDQFRHYFYTMDSTMKTLEQKAGGKITNNSLLRLEQKIL